MRLLAGQLVGYPPAEAEDCTIWFALADSGPDEWEGILGRRIDGQTAEIVGIPVFVHDVNLADHVAVETTPDGVDVASRVLVDAGNFTFRAFFASASEPSEHWRPLMTDLEVFGCWFDTWNEQLVAISAAPEHAQAVAHYLAKRERRGELQYETGRLGRHR
ncbi:MAG: DUF4265 domain-containing protein [Gaiellaceae bacterium]